MEECVDGEYQAFKSKDGAFVRKEFFGKYPELHEMVSHMTDDEVWELRRGGHDPVKIYAAYAAAVSHQSQPTVILAKTIKGLWPGAGRRGNEHRSSAEENGCRCAEGVPRPLQNSHT